MKKLVVLKLDGGLEQGVRVALEIGEEGERPNIEVTGQLPGATDLVTAVEQWQSTYRSFGKSERIKAKKVVYVGSITKWCEDCKTSAVDLRKRLNNWLLSESFRPIRETWLQQLSPSDEVRVLIRTSSVAMRKLPWHLWDLVEEYPLAEVAYSAPKAEREAWAKTPTYRDKVRILAILGNSTGINVQKDRQLLENLPDAAVTFLVEPQRQDINDQLWNQPWDILFFAGHSQSEGETGRIYINQTHSLTIADLKYALRNAVANGLQLAIFNSCDGLGLAFELEQLHIGQMIVMREPVPDRVAQTFLTYFLAAFASGKSFYLAEREARLKLQGLEDEFPCASWLPMIFQNPAAAPPSWQDLGRRPTEVCPYRGLFAFREEDAPFFYGRDAFTQMLVEAVQQQSLVAVIGPSGSGKSSVVFAGLIPQLRSERTWLIEAFRPGDRPFRNLAAKLVPLLETQMSETDQLLEINKLAKALRQGDLTLRDAIARILEKKSGDRLLLVAASASYDGIVKLWSIEGRELHALKGHSDSVTSVSFSPDGKTIASASSDGTVKLWSIEGRELHTFRRHRGVNTSISFSPDGKTIASASADDIVKLWSIEGRELHTLKGHSASVTSVSFSPDGKTIASASADDIVKLWSFTEGRELHTLKVHSGSVTSVSFNPDGKTIAYASSDGTIKLWSVESGEFLYPLKGHSGSVTSVSFSPNGKTITSASVDKTVKLWSFTEGGELHTLKGHSGSVTSVSFSPNGKTIASASDDGKIILWNFDLEDLLVRGCDWLREQNTNPNVSESDKYMCDGIGNQK